MNCRLMTDLDYDTAVGWWKGHDFPAIPKEVLPPTGAVVDGHCLGWVYLSNGGIAYVEWIVGNPDIKGRSMVKALNILIEKLIQIAKENDNHRVYSSVKNKSLLKIMTRMGFTVCDEDMTNLLFY